MKVTKRPPKKTGSNVQSETFSLSDAKTYLGRLMEKASQGQIVYIARGQRRFVLQEVPPIDPIPIRPIGYFADAYTKREIVEENQLAKASVLQAPRDLE